MFNMKTFTLGGKQLWTDYVWRQGWTIQLNAITGHWRLLDEKNVRHAWGSRKQCQEELERLVPDGSVTEQEAMILLHGLGRSSASMRDLGEYIQNRLGILPIYLITPAHAAR